MELNWLDIILSATMVLSIIISFFRGFMREVVSLIAWTLGIGLALKFADPLADTMQPVVTSDFLRYLLAFAGIFLVFFILGVITNTLIRNFVEKNGVTITDRTFGLFFGAARGFLAVTVVLMFMKVTPAVNTQWYQKSQLVPRFAPAVKWLDSYLPSRMHHMQNWVGTSPDDDNANA